LPAVTRTVAPDAASAAGRSLSHGSNPMPWPLIPPPGDQIRLMLELASRAGTPPTSNGGRWRSWKYGYSSSPFAGHAATIWPGTIVTLAWPVAK
jgi:hypothetical protein